MRWRCNAASVYFVLLVLGLAAVGVAFSIDDFMHHRPSQRLMP